ncbi:MAG TPA: hypothetical protein VGK67_09640 [Myxococcales bacterium]|jgi:pyruvate ferredoxin oxidoreductase alpha subunit
MTAELPLLRHVAPYGATYAGAIDLPALRAAHRARFQERETLAADGNLAAALPFLQLWRSPLAGGVPVAPAAGWLEHLSREAAGGRLRVRVLESERAVAGWMTGVAAACRGLLVATATGGPGLDRMADSLRGLGASGLGNAMVVNVARPAGGFPSCQEGDPSDALAHRDLGFVQIACRGVQQIYDTVLQLPAVGMHPAVLTPTMPILWGVKDSHRTGKLVVEPDEAVNAFLDEALALGVSTGRPEHADILARAGADHPVPPGLLDGDTAMGATVTSDWFAGFKANQKQRLQNALAVVPEVARAFERRFGRPGLSAFESHAMEEAEVALVAMGPDAGTALELLPALSQAAGLRVGLLIVRMISPFPSQAIAQALGEVSAVGVVNGAHHEGRGHLTVEIDAALAERGTPLPVASFFAGLGGGAVGRESWELIARRTAEAARAGRPSKRWHLVQDGVELEA